MTDKVDLGPLIERLKVDLEREFPAWLISREASGRWSAKLPRWGVLYGQSAPELRDRLRLHAPRGRT